MRAALDVLDERIAKLEAWAHEPFDFSTLIARLEAVERRAGFKPVGDDGDPWRWRHMSSAPCDGTVVELCARYETARAGFPRYGFHFDGKWFEATSEGRTLAPWAWRPRDGAWPQDDSELLP